MRASVRAGFLGWFLGSSPNLFLTVWGSRKASSLASQMAGMGWPVYVRLRVDFWLLSGAVSVDLGLQEEHFGCPESRKAPELELRAISINFKSTLGGQSPGWLQN